MAQSSKSKRWEVLPEKMPQRGPELREWSHRNLMRFPNGTVIRVGFRCGFVAHEASRPNGAYTGRRKEW